MNELSAALKPLKLDRKTFFYGDELDTLKALQWDEPKLMGLLEGLFAVCLAQEGRCKEGAISPTDTLRIGRADALLDLLGEVGTARALPLLWRLEARGFGYAELARVRIYERETEAALAASPCSPPSLEEVNTTKKDLEDFVVIRPSTSGFQIERPTPQELNDLAYFMAAVAQAGSEVGKSGKDQGSWMNPAPKNEAREALSRQFESAKVHGDTAEIIRAKRAYLATLGYPQALRGNEEADYNWGGARYSCIMRDLADALEGDGQAAEAANVYRTANPSGGACATSVDGVWANQVKGLIFVRQKKRAVAERSFLSACWTSAYFRRTANTDRPDSQRLAST